MLKTFKIKSCFKIPNLKFVVLVIFAFYGGAGKASAATYYLDGALVGDCAGGAGTSYSVASRDCSASDGTIAWNDFASANSTLTAGDTLYMRGGTVDYEVYNVTVRSGAGEGIQPDNSGTSYANMITYATYDNEMVHLQGDCDTDSCNSGGQEARGIWIDKKDYIKVTGSSTNKLKISKMFRGLEIIGNNPTSSAAAEYNEIAYVWIADSYLNYAGTFTGSVMFNNTEYNWIHHCMFQRHGWQQSGNVFQIGSDPTWSNWSTSTDRYNVVENCEFAHAGHAPLSSNGAYNVIRNNYIHNEPWTNEGTSYYYGFRGALSYDLYTKGGRILFEGNRIGHAGRAYGSETPSGTDGLDWAQSDAIMRYNSFFNNGDDAIEFRGGMYANKYYIRSNNNRLYSNTFYNNGVNQQFLNWPHLHKVILFYYTSAIDYQTAQPIYWQAAQDNVVKNNLFYNNMAYLKGQDAYDLSNGLGSPMEAAGKACPSSQTQGCNIISNNYNDDTGENVDPKFVDTTLTSYESGTLPNLNLQSDSPAINQGTYLTQAKGAGTSSTTLIVDDAQYFQDGKFGSASGCDPSKWAPGIDIQADYLAIGAVDNVVQIDSIDYSTNTITLASAKTWDDNASIWLYKKSDGQQVCYGSAPDYGAHEYVSAGDTTAPSAPSGLSVT